MPPRPRRRPPESKGTGPDPPHPTGAELALLRVLWERGPSTVREVWESLPGTDRPGYTTVLKLFQIMTAKGLVERDDSQRAHIYRTHRSRTETQRQLVGDLLDRAFQGSAAKLVQQALSSRPAPPEELAEIRRLLDSLDPGATSGRRSQKGDDK